MEKTLLLQGKILKLQQLFAKNWLQYGGPGYQSRVVAGRLSTSVAAAHTHAHTHTHWFYWGYFSFIGGNSS